MCGRLPRTSADLARACALLPRAWAHLGCGWMDRARGRARLPRGYAEFARAWERRARVRETPRRGREGVGAMNPRMPGAALPPWLWSLRMPGAAAPRHPLPEPKATLGTLGKLRL